MRYNRSIKDTKRDTANGESQAHTKVECLWFSNAKIEERVLWFGCFLYLYLYIIFIWKVQRWLCGQCGAVDLFGCICVCICLFLLTILSPSLRGKVFFLSTRKLLVTKLSWVKGFPVTILSAKWIVHRFWNVYGLAFRKAFWSFQTWCKV